MERTRYRFSVTEAEYAVNRSRYRRGAAGESACSEVGCALRGRVERQAKRGGGIAVSEGVCRRQDIAPNLVDREVRGRHGVAAQAPASFDAERQVFAQEAWNLDLCHAICDRSNAGDR